MRISWPGWANEGAWQLMSVCPWASARCHIIFPPCLWLRSLNPCTATMPRVGWKHLWVSHESPNCHQNILVFWFSLAFFWFSPVVFYVCPTTPCWRGIPQSTLQDLQRLLPPVLRRSLPHGQRSPNLWLWAVPGHDDMPWLHKEISPCPPFWASVSLWRWFSILKPSRQVSVAYRTDCSFGSRFAFCSSTMSCTYLFTPKPRLDLCHGQDSCKVRIHLIARLHDWVVLVCGVFGLCGKRRRLCVNIPYMDPMGFVLGPTKRYAYIKITTYIIYIPRYIHTYATGAFE